MLQLSFNQKVGLGFFIIIFLLLISGLSSLWNLHDIDNSTTRVNDTAVPVVKESNRVQIQLLKLAKLSSLAYNATSQTDILKYQKDFEVIAERFEGMQKSLSDLTRSNAIMGKEFKSVQEHYRLYAEAVRNMFQAKLNVLQAKDNAEKNVGELMNRVDDVGGALLEIAYYRVSDEKLQEDMELVAGFANGADAKLLGVIKTLEEVRISTDLARLEQARDDFNFVFNDSRNLLESGARVFRSFDEEGMLDYTYEAYDALKAGLDAKPNVVDFKIRQLEEAEVAKQQLITADAEVSTAIAGLDNLLDAADTQFNTLQSDVFATLDFGFKSSIGMLIVLIVLAAQNFNSMRQAIRKKMIDLAKLNDIGRSLAAARDQNSALEEVLQSMHEKIGVDRGSVYLLNEDQQLEVRAYFPPKVVDPTIKPTKFTIGQGVLGQVAESKKVVFVPNTAKDKNFVSDKKQSGQALLCVPLVDKDVLIGVINLSGDVKKVAFADSDYEFVSSVARSLVTTIKNIRMREVIEEHNRNLEQKVQERTAALHQKNQDIANMMANMHQGLFTITAGGQIHPEYAAYLETIFETKRIAGRNFADLLFSNTTLGADSVDQNVTAVDAIVGEDEMMYDFNSHCLVNEMVITFEEGRQKILELDWDPITTDEVIEKLMVTVRDVTELKALEAEAEEQKRELAIIGEILAVDARKFNDFVNASEDFVGQCRTLISDTQAKDKDIIALLFRNMHTVKGNARTYGLKLITDVVHNVEQTYDELRKNEEMEWQPSRLLQELEGADQVISKYAHVFRDKLGRDSAPSESGVLLDASKVSGWLANVKTLSAVDMQPQVKQVVSDAFDLLISMDAEPLSRVIQDVVASVQSLAVQLDKAEPKTVIEDGGIFIHREAHSVLNNIFMHVFRNAIDHGIEGETERLEKGKPAFGTIKLDTVLVDGFAEFAVQDDGRGIAISKIYNMAVEKGIYAADAGRPDAVEIANLIFHSGFSTAEEVTDVSGRGVGMDAVKGFLEKEGGSIEVVLEAGNETDDFRAFSTRIRLPDKFFVQAPEFSRTA